MYKILVCLLVRWTMNSLYAICKYRLKKKLIFKKTDFSGHPTDIFQWLESAVFNIYSILHGLRNKQASLDL